MSMTDSINISEKVAQQLDAGSRIINLTEENSPSLLLNGNIDLSERVIVFRPDQFIEFGSNLNLNNSAIFLNGADAYGLPSDSNCVIVKGLIPSQLIGFGLDGELQFHRGVSPSVVGAFVKMHPQLFETKHEYQLNRINPFKASSADIERFFAECWFIIKNPSLPLENIGSSLQNYLPKSQSQEQAKAAAEQLLSLSDQSMPAGLFIEGTVGVGKTHLCVALALEFMTRGWPTHFISAQSGRLTSDALESRHPAVWILDDLNGPYGSGMDIFKKLIVHIHETGGRLFVTSNTDLNYLLEHGFTIDQAERPKILDRFKGMMLALKVTGDSNRSVSPWYMQKDAKT